MVRRILPELAAREPCLQLSRVRVCDARYVMTDSCGRQYDAPLKLARIADTCVQGAQSCIYRRRYIRADESGGFQVWEVG